MLSNMANFNKNAAVRVISMFFVILVVQDEKNTVVASPFAEAPPSITIVTATDNSVTIKLNNCKTPTSYNYTVKPTQLEACYSDFSNCLKINRTQLNVKTCEITVPNLCANAVYDLVINNTKTNFKTYPSWPTDIQISKVDVTQNSVSLSWIKPRCPTNYEFRYIIRYTFPGSTGSTTVQVPLKKYKHTIPKLNPSNIAYSFSLQACLQENTAICHEVARFNVKHEQKDPFPIKISGITKNSATITYSATPFIGHYDRYTLIVGAAQVVANSGNSAVESTYNDTIKWPQPIYITSPLNWNPITGIWESMNCTTVKGQRKCIIGFQTNCNKEKYCNGPLRPKFNYGVKIRGYYGNSWNETNTYSCCCKCESGFRL